MRANSAVNWARGELPQPRSWKVTEKTKGKEEKMLLRSLRVPCSIFCVPRLVFRVSCSIRHARTSFENFGCERGLRLSTHWQWSVMVTGEQASKRASEQSSNRATEHTTNRTTSSSIRCTVRSFTRHYPECYVLARILHVLAICTTSFFANRN